jgi:flagellar basal-body rod protein FlgG
MRALSIAATGMSAQQTNVDVIANNIANINTTAFKRARAEFSDLMYQTDRAEGVPNAGGQDVVPEGAQIGLGVRTVGVRNLHTQGPMAQTSNPLDVAIDGRGWFQITGPSGETLYTRAGSFNKNGTGQLVTGDGYLVNPAITIPTATTQVTINESGEVYATVSGQAQPQLLGQLALVDFANDAGLQPLGNNLYRETTASGSANEGVAGDPGFGTIRQGYLEQSNVDPVTEITELISAQRAYEMNSKVITAADQMQQQISQGIK